MMTVDVGDKLREFICSLVKAGDYLTQSEIMRDILRQRREIRLNYVFRNYANKLKEIQMHMFIVIENLRENVQYLI